MTDIHELLPWLNAAILPAIYYIAKLERRMIKLEVLIALHLKINPDEIDKIGA